MTDVYSTVLSEETISQPPAESAQIWVDTLLLQLELDGFAGVSVGTIPKADAQLAFNTCTHLYT
jgi:hypothetical protein